jgi:hypothetical protein
MLSMSLATVAFAQDAPTQKKFRFGLGPDYSLAVGELEENYTNAFGANITGVYNLTSEVSTFIEASARVFKNKTGFNHEFNATFIAGGRYNYQGFFAGAGLGHSIWIDNNSGFTYDLQLGYTFPSVHIFTHYTSSKTFGSSLSYVGLKVYYMF